MNKKKKYSVQYGVERTIAYHKQVITRQNVCGNIGILSENISYP